MNSGQGGSGVHILCLDIIIIILTLHYIFRNFNATSNCIIIIIRVFLELLKCIPTFYTLTKNKTNSSVPLGNTNRIKRSNDSRVLVIIYYCQNYFLLSFYACIKRSNDPSVLLIR